MRLVPAYLFLASLIVPAAQSSAPPVTVVLPFAVTVDGPAEAPPSGPATASNGPAWARDADWIGASFAQRIREELMRSGMAVAPYIETREAASDFGLTYGAGLSDAAAVGIAKAVGANRILRGNIVLQPADLGAPVTPFNYEARVIDLDALGRGPTFGGQGTLGDLIPLEIRAGLQARAALHSEPKNYAAQLAEPAPTPEDVEAYLEKLPGRRLDAEELYARGLLAPDRDTRERYWRQSLLADHDFGSAAFALGQMLYRRRWYTRAAGWLELVTPEDPRYPAALFMRGVQALEAHDAELAKEIFLEVIARAPSPEARNNLAVAESRIGLPFAAANLQELALQYPHDPDYLFNAAYTAWKTGQFATAADGFARLLKQEETPVAHLLHDRALAEYGPSDSLGDDRLEDLERIKRVVPPIAGQAPESAGE